MIDKILMCIAAGGVVMGGVELYEACRVGAVKYQERAWDRADRYQEFMRRELPPEWNLPTESRPAHLFPPTNPP